MSINFFIIYIYIYIYIFIIYIYIYMYRMESVIWRAILLSRLRLKNTPSVSLQKGKTLSNKCPGYNTKQSDGEVPIMLELWGMQSIPLLPSLPFPLWLRVVATDRVLSMRILEVNCVLMLNWIAWNKTIFDIVLKLNWNVWKRIVIK